MLPTAMLAGVAAALCLGFADFCVQRVTQSVGWLKGLAWSQLLGIPLMVGAALALDAAPPSEFSVWLPVLGLGVVNTLGCIALYRAFESGLLSVVSPIASTCGAVTVLLAVAFGRGPGLALGLASGLLLLGVVLVSSVRDADEGEEKSHAKSRAQQRAGILWAVLSALIFGGVFYALESVGHELGPVWAVAALRVVAAPLLWGLFLFRRSAPGSNASRGLLPDAVWLPLGVAVVLDGAGLVAYTWGTQLGELTLVAVLTSMFSAVTVLLAQRFLRERLSARQWLGLVLTLVGVASVIVVGS